MAMKDSILEIHSVSQFLSQPETKTGIVRATIKGDVNQAAHIIRMIFIGSWGFDHIDHDKLEDLISKAIATDPYVTVVVRTGEQAILESTS